MNVQFSQLVLFSFYQWLDNKVLQNGQAYTNYTSQLFYQYDPQLGPGYATYAAPFKSFVWDSGVSGAQMFNQISGPWGTLGRGQSGMITDFVNGRVIVPASATFGPGALVSGSYAFKDFNVYFANQTQENAIFTNKYYLNGRTGPGVATGIQPYSLVTPCIFITNANEDNKPFAIGGIYNTTYTIGINILAENLQQLEGVLSILVDQQDGVFPVLPTYEWPLNFYGDYKSGYNYQQVLGQYGTPGNYMSITKVRASKVSDYVKIQEDLFLGLVDITASCPRTIR